MIWSNASLDFQTKQNLFQKLDRCDIEELQAFLKTLKHIDFVDPKTTLPPLTYAVELKWIEGLRVLIEAGANVNFQLTPQDNALVAAVRLGQVQMVEILLKAGANPNGIQGDFYYDFEPDSPLSLAIQKENREILDLLIEAGVNVNDRQNSTAPISLAIHRGNLDLVKALIEAGAFLTKELYGDFSDDDYGEIEQTNRFVAATLGHRDIVEYLLPLVSCQEDRRRAVEELPKAIARKQEQMEMQDLIVAASTGNIKAVKELIEAGINVNGVGFHQKTALTEACFFGQCAVVRVLLNAGANLSKASFVRAIYGNRSNIVEFLIHARFNPNQCVVGGYTALMLAAKFNCLDIVKVLLEAGVDDINTTNLDGETALDLARRYRYKEIVRVLKEYGALGDAEIEEIDEGEDIPF
ncbi:MAG: ankyrin repeat domain-containing protein [Cyanobacteria bacterium SID2]|nr:ankyrin repeat domain-containing protein [Cyanobacteria bacterium SID2]